MARAVITHSHDATTSAMHTAAPIALKTLDHLTLLLTSGRATKGLLSSASISPTPSEAAASSSPPRFNAPTQAELVGMCHNKVSMHPSHPALHAGNFLIGGCSSQWWLL